MPDVRPARKVAQGTTHKVPMVSLPVMSVPFARIAMDMVGPLPQTDEGHKFVLTVCDYGMKFPEAFPMKTTTSKEVAEALVELFSRVGLPEEILSDRGTNLQVH